MQKTNHSSETFKGALPNPAAQQGAGPAAADRDAQPEDKEGGRVQVALPAHVRVVEEDHVAQPAADQQQHRRSSRQLASPGLPAAARAVEPAAAAGEGARAGPSGFEVVVN